MSAAADSFHGLWIVVTLTSYIVLIKLPRHRRMAEIEGPFANGQRPLSSMTAREAHAIMAKLQEMEFSPAFAKARQKALLKVRPSIDRF